MTCCSPEGTNKCFSRHARRYSKRFRKKGLDKQQSILAKGILEHGVASKTILEIGCGAGGLHLSLLQKGAASAVGVEIAEGMLNQAREHAGRMGLSDRTSYHLGDFVGMNGSIPDSDIVILDKVLCCYADVTTLIHQSTEKCRALYAATYPRDSILARLFFKPAEWFGELLRWSFHPYYHEPATIENMIMRRGFEEVVSQTTPIWQVKIYKRASGGTPVAHPLHGPLSR